ncbi:hypothetical protein HCTV5_52 [Halovirus HCTV-5]|uniref:hypothetical protein n=1 Tax=Halovirus HCTV-5 TaxID=1273748 RepID=UPI0003348BDC|nr:hypothetical protein M200_gp052 [Halovirus HCTV-5]AGM11662.1 hypothetical protein HCTV5_52 [Halovirus HCTV-5]
MSDLVSLVLAVLCVIFALVALWQWYEKKAVVRHVNRRLVAYEGKLRNLGHEPDRVYHDFENMLEGNVEDRQAAEFDTESTREEDDA